MITSALLAANNVVGKSRNMLFSHKLASAIKKKCLILFAIQANLIHGIETRLLHHINQSNVIRNLKKKTKLKGRRTRMALALLYVTATRLCLKC